MLKRWRAIFLGPLKRITWVIYKRQTSRFKGFIEMSPTSSPRSLRQQHMTTKSAPTSVVYSSTPVMPKVLRVLCSLAHSRLPLSGRGTASDSRQTPPPKATAKHCPRLTNDNTLSADWRLTATEWPKHRESSWVHLGAHSLHHLIAAKDEVALENLRTVALQSFWFHNKPLPSVS